MAVLDIILLLMVGLAASGGFVRGFAQEIWSLAAWLLAVFAIRHLHADLAEALHGEMGSPAGAAIFAFTLLLLIPYAAMKLIVRRAAGGGGGARALSPFDRALGLGFGAVKGVVIVVLGFSLLVLGYDPLWGTAGRPVWLSDARSYQFADASSRALVAIIEERRARVDRAQEQSPPP